MKYLRNLLIASTIFAAPTAYAQQTLYVAGPGGSQQKLYQSQIFPAFEAKHNVKITYVPGISSEIVAKLQAQAGKQEINVAIVDDGPLYQAIQFGYCDKLTNPEAYKDIYPFAQFGGNGIGIGLVATGLAYNTANYKKKGWAAPTSWNDLTEKKLDKRVTASSLSGTYGLHTLVMFARINGGSETNVDPGFEAIRKGLAPNVLSWSSSPAKLAEMFQNNDVDIAVWGTSRTIAMKNTGFPIDFVYPKEGTPALVLGACPVVQNSQPEASQALLQYLVTPEVQQKLAIDGLGPTNRQTKLDATTAEQVPYGEERIGKMITINWNEINPKRSEWTNRWNRTIER